MTNEFSHYPGCRLRDPDNCSGCALTTGGPEGPNYTAWPLVYMENRMVIPAKWRKAFKAELCRTDNPLSVANLREAAKRFGVALPDGVTQ